jgi:hypothetical protein
MFKKRRPEWADRLDQSRERWFTFLEKLEERMEELCTAAIPELKEVLAKDDDVYKRNFHKVYSGVQGQLGNIRQKAYDTYDEKILGDYYSLVHQVSALDPGYDYLKEFQNQCSERYNDVFEKKLNYWEKQIEMTKEEDLEIKYKKILDEYETVKHKFTCKQCGAALSIDKIFFISTYVACPACRTQNTFAPSSSAQMIQHFSRDLAHQRVSSLYEAYVTENEKERIYYHQIHKLRLSNISSGKAEKKKAEQEMAQLEQERKASIENTPKLYRIYLRALYDEMNKITPDLKEHNEKMYENAISQYNSYY